VSLCTDRALRKVNRLFTARTLVRLFEFVRKDLDLFVTLGTLAGEGFQILMGLETGAMLWCAAHSVPPSDNM
jgi:hypothetical protein